jgi:hypothetical protein
MKDLMMAPDTLSRSPGARQRNARRGVARDELGEAQRAATVALAVLRRALVEGTPVTREAITHEACIVYATGPAEATFKLDAQAEGLGISSLV